MKLQRSTIRHIRIFLAGAAGIIALAGGSSIQPVRSGPDSYTPSQNQAGRTPPAQLNDDSTKYNDDEFSQYRPEYRPKPSPEPTGQRMDGPSDRVRNQSMGRR